MDFSRNGAVNHQCSSRMVLSLAAVMRRAGRAAPLTISHRASVTSKTSIGSHMALLTTPKVIPTSSMGGRDDDQDRRERLRPAPARRARSGRAGGGPAKIVLPTARKSRRRRSPVGSFSQERCRALRRPRGRAHPRRRPSRPGLSSVLGRRPHRSRPRRHAGHGEERQIGPASRVIAYSVTATPARGRIRRAGARRRGASAGTCWRSRRVPRRSLLRSRRFARGSFRSGRRRYRREGEPGDPGIRPASHGRFLPMPRRAERRARSPTTAASSWPFPTPVPFGRAA